jgi:hypothetical protein
MDELIQTPYGELNAAGLEELRKSFDTRQIWKRSMTSTVSVHCGRGNCGPIC